MNYDSILAPAAKEMRPSGIRRFFDMAAERVKQSGAANGFRYIEICDSPILGGDGNKEFIAHFIYEGDGVRK